MMGWPEVLRGAGRAGGMAKIEVVGVVAKDVTTVIGGAAFGRDVEAL